MISTTVDCPPTSVVLTTGRVLLWVCVAGAAFGFVVIAGLFALLAVRPHLHLAVWLLVSFHKVAMTVTALTYASGGNVADATSVAIADGILSALLIAAFVLLRPWQRPVGTP